MVKSITQHYCELCGTGYLSVALAKKCENSPQPNRPFWPKVGEAIILKDLSPSGKIEELIRATVEKWVVVPTQAVQMLSDEELLSKPGDFEFHEWMLGVTEPVFLEENWPEPRRVVSPSYALTGYQVDKLRASGEFVKEIKKSNHMQMRFTGV